MIAHTPGPWTLETVKTSVGVCHKIGPFPGSCGRKVGMACVYEDGMHLWRTMDRMESELLANARLMAAAPDLLNALKGILAGFNAGAFCRNTDGDAQSDWAIKAFPHLQALAAAQALVDAQEATS